MTRALFFVDYPERLALAERLRDAASENGDDLICFTNQLSLFMLGRRRGLKIHLCKTHRGGDLPGFSKHNHEVRGGFLTEPDARLFYNAVYHVGAELCRQHSIDLLINWNGAHLHSLVCKALSRDYNIPLVFVEIGNIKGKMLFSPHGSGSDLQLHPRPPSSTSGQLAAWVEAYRNERLRQAVIPQAASNLKANYLALIDRIGWGRLPRSTSHSATKKLTSHALRRQYLAKLESLTIPTPREDYVFFPLQVSEDTNLTTRSSVDNFEGIRQASEIAASLGSRLAIKIHPAERSGPFLRELYLALKSRAFGDIDMVRGNAAELIIKSKHVVTINSTIGVEAILFDRPYTALAPVYYAGWDAGDIYWYANEYLLNFNLFSPQETDAAVWPAIVARGEVLKTASRGAH